MVAIAQSLTLGIWLKEGCKITCWAFVQIVEDIEGLVAISELSWTKSNAMLKITFSKGES
jgi:hypothetical protein